jgi:4-amino-4-deoxy-L-arabinose transferase-like glycosyltransferase
MPQFPGTAATRTIAAPRLPPPVWWWLPWLSAVAVFIAGEWSRPGDRPTLIDWFLQAEADALIYLALLIAAPLLWWFRRDKPRQSGAMRPNPPPRLDELVEPCKPAISSHWRPIVLSTLIGFASLAASAHVGAQFDDLPPAFHDEYSYLFQAETFLAGRVSFPSHPAARLFDQMHVLNEGRFASRYFPGTGLWMAPFVALGHPYWGHWAAGAICAVLMFWIGRELAGDSAGLTAGLLTALSPGMALFSNLLLAHHPTLVGLGVFILGFLRMIRSGAPGWALVSGAGLAFAMLCRPMTAAGVALPFGVYAVFWAIQQKRRVIVWLGIPLLVALGGLFVYDQSITGSGWQTPYGVYTNLHTPRHVYGFNNVERGNRRQGPRVIKNYDEWAENLTPRLAAANAGTRLAASAKWSLGLIPLTLSFVGGLVVWQRLNQGTGLILASIVSLHAVHIPYWFVGMEDHHYVFEAGPLWCLWVAAVSITVLRLWHAERRVALCAWWGGLLSAAVAMNATTSGGLWSAPLEQGIGRVAFARAEHGRFTKLVATRAVPQPALVLVDADPADRHIDYVVNSPDLSGPLLIGHYIPETVSLNAVRNLFPDRSLFVYRIRNVFRDGHRLREEDWRKVE